MLSVVLQSSAAFNPPICAPSCSFSSEKRHEVSKEDLTGVEGEDDAKVRQTPESSVRARGFFLFFFVSLMYIF